MILILIQLFHHVSIYCHFFHFFINLSVYFNFCTHSLVFLLFSTDSQDLLLASFYPFLPQMNVHPLTGFWPFRSERPFGFSTPFRCKAPPNGFLTVLQWEAFWDFDFVSLRARPFSGFWHRFIKWGRFMFLRSFVEFTPLRVHLTLTSILYPFEFLRSFAVLDYYMCNWSLMSILYPFEVLRSFAAFRPSWVLTFTSILYPCEFLTSFVAFRPLRV